MGFGLALPLYFPETKDAQIVLFAFVMSLYFTAMIYGLVKEKWRLTTTLLAVTSV